MADPRFFKNAGPFTVSEIATRVGADIEGDADLSLSDVAPLDVASGDQLSFLDNIKYKEQFTKTAAGACFVHPDFADQAPEGLTLLVTAQPYKAYALAAQAFYPFEQREGGVSDQAFVAHDAVIGAGTYIEAGAIIKSGAQIGENCLIEAGAVIGENVSIGNHVRIGTNASVSHAVIKDHSRLYPGVCAGQDGFGFAIDPAGFVKVPQLGRVIIEEHVEIGANTCIDRGAGPDTVIGQGTWIDNLVQIGHNVRIGRGCVIVSQVGISGSTVLEDFVMIGGQGGLAGHLHIGKGAKIAAQSGVIRDIPAGEEQMGYPAMPMRQFMKQVAFMKRLIKKNKDA